MKGNNKQYYVILFLTICFFFCQKKEGNNKDWIQTQNDYVFFGNVDSDTLNYIWEGNVFENIIHGDGVLLGYHKGELIERKNVSAYWGSLKKEDVLQLSNDEEYIGSITKGKFFNGFGVLVKGDREVYIGHFAESKPNGFLTLYKNDKVYYKGEWKDGAFNGFGTLRKEDGSVKKGIWKNGNLSQTDETVQTPKGIYSGGILNNLSEGYGIMKYKNGGHYEGIWHKGKWNGKGFFISNRKDSITGDWQGGKLEGYGLFKSSLFLYEGDWRSNKPNGIGYIVYADSTFYTGSWSEGKKTGYGDIIYSNSDSYFGEWLEDEPDGIGRYYYNNGDSYNGEWKNGLQHGAGIYNSKDFRYEGNWQKGWINGKGKIAYPNGDYYEGDFVENEKSGTGYYHFKNGNFYEGEFIDNQFNGLGVFQFVDGNRYEGDFNDGKINGDGTLYYREGETTLAITAFWDGTNNFPERASVLFSNGDLYEGELVNGFPTKNGTWTTEEERIKGKDLSNQLSRANEFYKKHRDTWNKAVIGISVVLTAVGIDTASTGIGVPVAVTTYAVNVGLNVLDAGMAIASAAIDVNTALQNDEDPTEAYVTLATEVSVNAALILVPKALQKPAATRIKNATKNTVRNSIVAFSRNKSFAKVIAITKDAQGKLVKTLETSKTKWLQSKAGVFTNRLTTKFDHQAISSKIKSDYKNLEIGKSADGGVLRRNMLRTSPKLNRTVAKEKVISKRINPNEKRVTAEAHHIVAGNKPSALRARKEYFEKHGIDINDPHNGILLPTNPRSIFKGARHGNHVSNYDDYVYQKLKEANPQSREEVIEVLDLIKRELYKGELTLLKNRSANTLFSIFKFTQR